LKTQDIALDLTPDAVELLIDKGFDPTLGARPLKRAIQRLLEDPFAEFILKGQMPAGSTVRVSRKDDKLDFSTGGATVSATTATSSTATTVPSVPGA